MPEDLKAIWDYTLAKAPGGQAITVGEILMVLALVVGGYVLSRLIVYFIGRRMAKASVRPDVIHVFKRIMFIVFLVVVALTALSLLGIPLTAFAFATGAIAIGVGFGAQNIINNFISGWILIAERPIRIGDFIEIDAWQGSVEAVGTRSTRIRRTDGVHLLVPNSQLLERTVVNWTLVDREIRTTVRVGVAYGSPVRKVAELIMRSLDEHELVKKMPAPLVVFEDFGDSALIFDAYFWSDVGGERELRTVRSDLRFRIDELFAEHDIVIAFPQRDVHLDTQRPLRLEILSGQSGDSGDENAA